jgi:hypothetical protein
MPSRSGGKKPPRPPIAPTSPVTVPVSRGKYCGTSLKTAPLPKPINIAQPNAPIVKGRMEIHPSRSANGTMAANTAERARAPPRRSESQPPTGRIRVARTTNPADRNPASAAYRWNWSFKRLGRRSANISLIFFGRMAADALRASNRNTMAEIASPTAMPRKIFCQPSETASNGPRKTAAD